MRHKKGNTGKPPTRSNKTAVCGQPQIREQAEQKAQTLKPPALESMTHEEIEQMFHEMQVKQLETELQNEQLRGELEEYDDYTGLLTTITENMLGIVVLSDLEGNIRFAGQAHEILGYEPDFLVGKNVMDFVHPDHFPYVFEEFNKLLASGDPRTVEYQFRCRDGSYMWLETVGRIVPDENNNPEKIVFSAREITERKQDEEALQESEERFRTVLENLPGGIFVHDLNGKILMVNDLACKNTGYLQEELLQMYVKDIDPYAVSRRDQTILWRRLEMGQSATIESVHIRKDGTQYPVELHLNAIILDGEPAILPIAFDITERRQAEQQLRESEEKYRRIAENITDVVWTADLNLNTTYVTPSIRKLTGESPEEHMSRPLEEKIPPADLDKIYQVLTEELEKENDPASDKNRTRLLEVKHYKTDGATVWVSMNVSSIRDENGDLVGFQGVTRDVTERKKSEREQEKLQAQLSHAQKMESLGRLAGGVAHDFNNMLSIINGYAEISVDMLDPAEPLYENIREIYKAGKRSVEIVRQLLAFARKQTISPVRMDLNDTVSSLFKMLQRLIGENIDLAWHPGSNLWPVKIDPSQLDQIMANLAVNARDAIADVGKMTIETKNVVIDQNYCLQYSYFVPGEYVMLAVSDNGSGMEKEVQDNLFEPFFTTKEIGKGTGLGLPTIYGIVKQNAGFINVYSEPGQGSTFKIYLPRHEAEGKTSGPLKESTEQMPAGSESILIVEDEAAILQLARTILERLGYTVLTAEKPEEALQIVEKHHGTIHLLITDIVMPEMNGRDLALKMSDRTPGLKTLYMSGYTANAIAHHGVIEEGLQFIQKPFSIRDLAIKVREVIDQE